MTRPRVLVLLGPTAVGKTAVAVELCRRLDGEVIAADSRQIYRGVEIGSAAPTPDELAIAPHHLVSFLEPSVVWSAAEFREAAEAAIADVLARGRQPLVVAGTGFYLSTLVYGWTLTANPAQLGPPGWRRALARASRAARRDRSRNGRAAVSGGSQTRHPGPGGA